MHSNLETFFSEARASHLCQQKGGKRERHPVHFPDGSRERQVVHHGNNVPACPQVLVTVVRKLDHLQNILLSGCVKKHVL
jgi:hypothetical protein